VECSSDSPPPAESQLPRPAALCGEVGLILLAPRSLRALPVYDAPVLPPALADQMAGDESVRVKRTPACFIGTAGISRVHVEAVVEESRGDIGRHSRQAEL